jgi:hypothetical protein
MRCALGNNQATRNYELDREQHLLQNDSVLFLPAGEFYIEFYIDVTRAASPRRAAAQEQRSMC